MRRELAELFVFSRMKATLGLEAAFDPLLSLKLVTFTLKSPPAKKPKVLIAT